MAAETGDTVDTAAGSRRLMRAAGTVMAAFVLSRVLGLAREVAISSRFGTGGELDAYLAAFRIPDILFQLMAGGALASAFIPTFAALLARGDEDEAWRLANSLINVIVVGVGLLSLLAAALAQPLVRYLVAPGFEPERQRLTVSLMRIMLLTPVVFAVSGVFMGILNSYQRFLAAALAPSAYNLAIILGAVVLVPRLGTYGLALGVAAGAVLHYLVQLPQVWRLLRSRESGVRSQEQTERFRLLSPGSRLLTPSLREVLRLMLPRTVGLAAVQVNFLANTILASLLSPGSLAIINFAWILMLLPQGVFAQAIATAVFPTFSAMAGKGDRDALAQLLLRAMRAVLFLALPATIGLVLLRGPIVSLVYQRQAFGTDSVAAVARVLAFYTLGLCAHSGLEVLTRAYYSLHDTRTPVAVGVAAMALNVVFSLVLMRPMRESGLALANALATWLEFGVLWLLFTRRLPGLSLTRIGADLLRIVAATLAMGLPLLLLSAVRAAPALVAVAGMTLGAGIYALATAALGVPEISLALAYARGLAKRRPRP
ncbi:MAG: murein biosynthesis integral membrane protein MurJ [Anaerolineae bacterium]